MSPKLVTSVGSFSGLAMMSETKHKMSKLAGGKLVACQATWHKINIAHPVIAHTDDISSFLFLYYFTFMLFKLWVKPQATQTPGRKLWSNCKALFGSD